MFEIDHFFIMSEIDAPEADLLVEFGFTEGESNTHPNQGTSNRRFFFHNVMLELLWVSNIGEAKSNLTKPTKLFERWNQRNTKSSPFGFCLRSLDNSQSTLPFETWKYKPTFLGNEHSILVANNSDDTSEPMIFNTPFGARPDSKNLNSSYRHAIELKEITSYCLYTPEIGNMSEPMEYIEGIENLIVKKSDQHYIEITFDGGKLRKQKSFKPKLPLIVRW